MYLEKLRRDPQLADLISLGLVESEGLPPEHQPELEEEITRTVDKLRSSYAGLTAGQLTHLRPARELYRSFGIEPTRYRPSPEALTRRLLRGDAFPFILPAVDLANLWAIASGLPVGLYDIDKLQGEEITLRRGRTGESYEGIRKGMIHLEGRPVVADDLGAFGNPSADSLRSSVDRSSQRLLYLLFAPPSVGAGTIDRWVAWLRERADAFFATSSLTGVIA